MPNSLQIVCLGDDLATLWIRPENFTLLAAISVLTSKPMEWGKELGLTPPSQYMNTPKHPACKASCPLEASIPSFSFPIKQIFNNNDKMTRKGEGGTPPPHPIHLHQGLPGPRNWHPRARTAAQRLADSCWGFWCCKISSVTVLSPRERAARMALTRPSSSTSWQFTSVTSFLCIGRLNALWFKLATPGEGGADGWKRLTKGSANQNEKKISFLSYWIHRKYVHTSCQIYSYLKGMPMNRTYQILWLKWEPCHKKELTFAST